MTCFEFDDDWIRTQEHSQEWLCHGTQEGTQEKPKTHPQKTRVGHPGNPREEGFLTPRTPFGMTCFDFDDASEDEGGAPAVKQ
jgi:hypothetical protein